MFEELQIYESPLMRSSEDVLAAFAWEEVLCKQVGQGHPPVAHLWRHENALVIGLRDRRLQMAPDVLRDYEARGIRTCVRPSGGAAVKLTPGVINVSLIMPNTDQVINIHEDFKKMVSYIQEALLPWGAVAKAGEIEGAFCPGDYDVSIAGRKFCGIAQRRLAKAYLITAFIIVEDNGDDLAAEVREFYDAAASGEEDHYPQVVEGTMGGLRELAGVPSVEAYMNSLIQVFRKQAVHVSEIEPVVNREEVDKMVTILKERYDRD
ncbi:lipoate--protein ligase family protein [Paenibacillus gallinarum]|uniref:Lipoate--protein ligase family protein n=1 Tax=Paenibacillus gallinarum TaxID=2762232 RepID=A0ABR8SZB3_9BACL|nr:lipoate--protein ligase family protein [Paenibacillus gallinarum]MBD7968857.1 lipoate--protein ligase family protein [Paenibacillus gallinarum]